MSASRRLINLAGGLLTLVLLIAGSVLMALPVFMESIDLGADRKAVAVSNQKLQTQIDGLRTKELQIPAIEQELEALHRQLPASSHTDDLSQLAVLAAAKVDARIDSISFGELTDFTVRDPQAVLDALPGTVSSSTAATAEPEADPDGASTDSGQSAPASADQAPVTSARQVQVTINVTAPDHAAVVRFLDELRAGPRLLQIETVTTNQDDDSEFPVTVTGLIFIAAN